MKPIIKIAWASQYGLKKWDIEVWEVLMAIPEPENEFDENAVMFTKWDKCVWYFPKEWGWRKHSQSLTFVVSKIKHNKWWYITYIYVEVEWAENISESIQDTWDTFPYRVYWYSWVPYPSITTVLSISKEDEQFERWKQSFWWYDNYKHKLDWYAKRWTFVHNALEDYINNKVVYDKEYFVKLNDEYKAKIDLHNKRMEESVSKWWYTKQTPQVYEDLNYASKVVKWTKVEFKNVMYDMYMWWLNFLKTHKVEPIEAEQILVSKKYQIAWSCDLFARVDWKLMVLDWKTSSDCFKPSYFVQAAFYASCYQEKYTEKVHTWIVKVTHETKKWFQFIECDWQEIHQAMIPAYRSVFEHQYQKPTKK